MIAENDRKKEKWADLDIIGRTKPTKWMSYIAGTLITKIMQHKFLICSHMISYRKL